MVYVSLWLTAVERTTGYSKESKLSEFEMSYKEINRRRVVHSLSEYGLPIPTIDELRLFMGRGAVRLQAGISCVRRCGVRGTSHLNQAHKLRHFCIKTSALNE